VNFTFVPKVSIVYHFKTPTLFYSNFLSHTHTYICVCQNHDISKLSNKSQIAEAIKRSKTSTLVA